VTEIRSAYAAGGLTEASRRQGAFAVRAQVQQRRRGERGQIEMNIRTYSRHREQKRRSHTPGTSSCPRIYSYSNCSDQTSELVTTSTVRHLPARFDDFDSVWGPRSLVNPHLDLVGDLIPHQRPGQDPRSFQEISHAIDPGVEHLQYRQLRLNRSDTPKSLHPRTRELN
jgi:hypothetical protein